jgi:glycosyltransferase involved in cell wall biosynthesis
MKLGIVMSTGTSCQKLEELGALSRSLKCYGALSRRVGSSILFTYTRDLSTEESLLGVYKNAFSLNPVGIIGFFQKFRYADLINSYIHPFLSRKVTTKCDLYRSMQIPGSWLARSLAKLHGVPFVLRAGYLWSDSVGQVKKNHLYGMLLRKWILRKEKILCRRANAIIVSASNIKKSMISKHGICAEKIFVIGTPVDTSLFKPHSEIPLEADVLMIGRLSEQKNYEESIAAIAKLGLSATIVGRGELKNQLHDLAESLNARIHWIDRVENEKIPDLMNKHRCYLIASHWEGCSKSLLEALSCGMLCIASDINENQDIIKDNVNGLLCDRSSSGIALALSRATTESDHEEIRANARKLIVSKYSVENAVEREFELYESLLS